MSGIVEALYLVPVVATRASRVDREAESALVVTDCCGREAELPCDLGAGLTGLE
jgi:hypothetical protein